MKSIEGHSICTASRKTCVIWNCVHHARKHLRGRRPPRDSGGVDANLNVFSRLRIAGLDDTRFSGELHWYTPARTYPSDSEARPVGCDERCQRRLLAHQNRVGVNDFVLRHCRRCSASRELAWSEPEFPARRERYLGLFGAAAPSGQVAEARHRVNWACWSGLQRLRSSAPRWRRGWHRPDRSALCDFFDSQRGLAPPGRVRGAPAPQDG